jgi:TRAP-type uncharacterized transport system substrate-binding protein
MSGPNRPGLDSVQSIEYLTEVRKMIQQTFLRAVCVATIFAPFAWVASAGAQQAPAQSDATIRRLVNQSTLGLAAGQLEGAPLRFATELARAVDDGNNMRVLPIVTRGPFENVQDLIYLQGVDAAIIYGDVLDKFRKDKSIKDIDKRINYITHLFPSEVHVFVRPEIKSLSDLAGKPVNFNTQGTAAAYTGPLVFERLGIKVDAHFDPHPMAMAEMAKGDKYAAIFWVTTKPIDQFLKRTWPEGFKFLPIPLTESLEQYYLPAKLEAADYPGLIPAGQSIQTIGVPAVLAVFAWREGTERYNRLVRFIDYLFERLPKLQSSPGFHSRWADLNLAATVPGWHRFKPMQVRLDKLSTAVTEVATLRPAPETKADSPRTGVRVESQQQARAQLEQAGFTDLTQLTLDSRNIWRGIAKKGAIEVGVALDQNGEIYSRKLPNIR